MTREDRQEQIKNLEDYNKVKLRQIQFNNIKIMVLKGCDKDHVTEEITKHFYEYEDEDEKQLLLTFLNKHANGNN